MAHNNVKKRLEEILWSSFTPGEAVFHADKNHLYQVPSILDAFSLGMEPLL